MLPDAKARRKSERSMFGVVKKNRGCGTWLGEAEGYRCVKVSREEKWGMVVCPGGGRENEYLSRFTSRHEKEDRNLQIGSC